jgi:hypothetical protein
VTEVMQKTDMQTVWYVPQFNSVTSTRGKRVRPALIHTVTQSEVITSEVI